MEGQNQQTLRVGSLNPIQTDVLIIGAGPVGLFQVFQLGLQEISAQVVDAHTEIGGQCSALYPDKFIYDIPGMPRITGQQLVDQLQTQISPFKAPFHLGQCVQSILTKENGFAVTTDTGTHFKARSIIIAAGVGAFVHRELPLPALKPFRVNTPQSFSPQVFTHLPEDVQIKGKALTVYGANESAVTLAIKASKQAHSGTDSGSTVLVYRREKLEIEGQLLKDFEDAVSSGLLQFRIAQITSIQTNQSLLTHLILTDTKGNEDTIPCDILIESLGLSPKLGPLVDWGIEMERKALKVNPETFATSTAGIYAVGDINTYPGKRKLILSGFHEATLAAYAIAARLREKEINLLEYTSASTRIHKLLGV